MPYPLFSGSGSTFALAQLTHAHLFELFHASCCSCNGPPIVLSHHLTNATTPLKIFNLKGCGVVNAVWSLPLGTEMEPRISWVSPALAVAMLRFLMVLGSDEQRCDQTTRRRDARLGSRCIVESA